MKKRIKNIVFIVAMIASVISYANNYYSVNVKKNSTLLTLANVKKGHELIIKDMNSSVMYRELINQNGTYTKEFDFKSLPDGSYYFELDKDVEITIIPFSIEATKVTFERDKETIIYKPVIRVVDNKVFLSRLSLDEHPIEVKIYYDELSNDDALIFTENIEDTLIAERVYKLSKRKRGNYTLVFNTQGKSFIEHIKF